MALIRIILGKLILFFNWAFPPRGIKRNAEQQAIVDTQTERLTLYQYRACPFCVKVRRQMKRQSLDIGLRDVKRDAGAREELLAGGRNLKVPCLRIEDGEGDVQWLYESNTIISHLAHRFPTPVQS
mgnify:FL=1|tara:strand:- start:13992 stop:14369 length:378 start_codon:yes stop_codon:yes gene_type:complete